MIHQKCIQGFYPNSRVRRFNVPENKVPWNTEFLEYAPVKYTASCIHGKPWADPEIETASFKPKWNATDGLINRKSFTGDYNVNKDGHPMNPIGRTGIIGRGLLGRWGPNHAVDAIITRWKRNNLDTLINKNTRMPILQFIAIQRKDSGEWALPGGMVDPGEPLFTAMKREFMEEALNTLDRLNTDKVKDHIDRLFEKGQDIYKGYVDDPRNTDNAWMETYACNFHDENNDNPGLLNLQAGDDAINVKWIDAHAELNLYANHNEFIKKTVEKHKAHW